MQHHYPFIVDYTREGQPIWSKFCPKCNSYSDYSNNCIIKIAKDHNINNWIKKHEEIFNKFR